ncbi:MAG: hypothetical protein GX070_01880 [Alcaligenaceae bacterium]|nr:hypothetical protein [Alcaligenaceae bacterium]
MANQTENFKPLTLVQHFEAPKGYRGYFGWLCGYSADAVFLNNAVERFTQLTQAQHSAQGSVSLALMLDPRHQQITPIDVSGALHLLFKEKTLPFRLLHAKVAILGFKHKDGKQWQLRLLVSTGNWTRQTLEESLDLAWQVNINSEQLKHSVKGSEQGCADIKAAWDLMKYILTLYDNRVLDSQLHRFAQEEVKEWLGLCIKKAKGRARFFDNRSQSLLSQLSKKIIKHDRDTAKKASRNYLAMGSGFYEAAGKNDQAPKVLITILDNLKREGLLSLRSEEVVFINPNACQAIASSLEQLDKQGIKVCVPNDKRSLHAKFLFSAHYRQTSAACLHSWVYLGSGNLTKPGFCSKMQLSTGNLEAGVVFFPEQLVWCEGEERNIVTNLLPIHWDYNNAIQPSDLCSGAEMEIKEVVYAAPPAAFLHWCEENKNLLAKHELPQLTFDVLNEAGDICQKKKTEAGIEFAWAGWQPRQVCVQWIHQEQLCQAIVPVMDQYGRMAATKLRALELDEAWWSLESFPLPFADEESEDEFNNNINNNGKQERGNAVRWEMTKYSIREMMGLVESIAAKQVMLQEQNWSFWCNRLEQVLGQSKDSLHVAYFREKLKLNPLTPLREPCFRPAFAETVNTEYGRLYEDTLKRIEVDWAVSGLTGLGEIK